MYMSCNCLFQFRLFSKSNCGDIQPSTSVSRHSRARAWTWCHPSSTSSGNISIIHKVGELPSLKSHRNGRIVLGKFAAHSWRDTPVCSLGTWRYRRLASISCSHSFKAALFLPRLIDRSRPVILVVQGLSRIHSPAKVSGILATEPREVET